MQEVMVYKSGCLVGGMYERGQVGERVYIYGVINSGIYSDVVGSLVYVYLYSASDIYSGNNTVN